MDKNLDITKPRYSEQIFLVPWHFVAANVVICSRLSIGACDEKNEGRQGSSPPLDVLIYPTVLRTRLREVRFLS